MIFIERIFARLQQRAFQSPVLAEIHDGKIVSVTGGELLSQIQQAREYLVGSGLKKGDRCTFLAPNGIRWAAMDLAMMAEGLIVVPLYTRQAPAELVLMIKDATPARIFCADMAIVSEIQKFWPQAPPAVLLDEVFQGNAAPAATPTHLEESDPVAILYTSGTSGEPKGAVITAGNVTHILGCTNERLDTLMKNQLEADRIFHYAPCNFGASWILLLTALSRNSVLTLATDLSKLAADIKLAKPDYFLNVPTLLERVRAKIEEGLRKQGGPVPKIVNNARRAYLARRDHRAVGFMDALCLSLANVFIFPSIRKSTGPNLKALICGSAPLAIETQLFFMMIGIPVLQVYGLTETTAICTMDDPDDFEAGYVGQAIPGIEMVVAGSGEILVRGPNVFSGYWQRPAETAKALQDGWFHTGDQGEVNARGSWRITGRIKNLIILNSGHNVAPEPIEQSLAAELPEAQQIVLVGDQRSFLAAFVTIPDANGSYDDIVQNAIDAVNANLPHYKQVRAFQILSEPFTSESGLLTVMGKLKRDAICARYASEIEQIYRKKSA